MLKSVNLGKELQLSVVNKIGVLADVSKVLADRGINIEALAGYAMEDNTAGILLVTDDNLRASDVLKKHAYSSVKEREVVIIELENKPGALRHITETLAVKDIDLKYVYGTACVGACPSKVILSTSDNQKALLILKK